MKKILLRTAVMLALAGCSTSPRIADYPKSRPLGRDLVIPPGLAEPGNRAPVAAASATPPEPAGRLTLRRALAQALTGSPDLAQFSYDIRSAEARTLQAGYRPNPEVSLLHEDFGGINTASGARSTQTTLAISQLIELGGKRAARLRLARLDESLAGWNYETQRLDVFAGTARAFMDVLAGQRRVALAEETLRLERQFYGAVSERVRAGSISPLEERRAQVTLLNGQIALDQARRTLEAARARLAAMWGGTGPRFERAEGDLGRSVRPPPLPALLALAAQNPDVARWDAEIAQREARVAVERSRNVPDVTLQGGPRRFGSGGSAFIAGVAVSLPVFGMNRGNLLDAQSQLGKSLVQKQAAEIRVTSLIRQAYERLSAAYETVKALRRKVLPAAQAAYGGIATGYQQGKFSLIEVLDARRALFDAQSRLVDALALYQTALVDAERLTGQPLGDAP